jgi:hypothetical protein
MLNSICENCGYKNYHRNLTEKNYVKMLNDNKLNNLRCGCERCRMITKQRLTINR